jgi:hypothetical protein
VIPLHLRVIVTLGMAAAVAVLAWSAWQAKAEALRTEGRTEVQAQWAAATVAANATQALRERSNAAAAAQAAAAHEAAAQAWAAHLQTRQQELRRVTSNLAACRLTVDAVRVLNAAATNSATDLQPTH